MVTEIIKPGYKKTEVGVIPEDWEERKIDTVCNLINGRGFKPFEWSKEGFPIIRIQNLNGSDEYNYYQGNYNKKIEVENGQLLFAWSGSRGTSFGPYIWHGSLGLLNYHTWKVVVNENEIDCRFFLHALRKLTKYIEDKAHGASALVHIQKWEMEGFKFPLPPTKEEQSVIAQALSDTDELIESLNNLITKKKNLKQGSMQELLTGKRRLPGFSGEWNLKKLSDIANITRGASPRPIGNPRWFDEKSEIGWVRISDVTKSRKHLFNTVQKLSSDGIRNSRPVNKNSLIMSICATVGRPILTKIDVCIHDGFVVFDKLHENIEFTYYYLLSIESKWSRHGQTGSQMNLNTTLINNEKIPIPKSPNEQSAIAEILSDMDAEIESLEQKRDKYLNLKAGMMQQLLTGRIRLI